MNIRSAYASTGLTNAGIALCNMLTGVAVARILGPIGRGQLSAIQTAPTLIAAVAMVGQTDALVYFAARREDLRRVVTTGVVVALVAATVLSAGFLFAAPAILSAQSNGVIHAARWYMVIGPLFAVVWLPFHILRGLGRFTSWNVLRLLPVIGWLLVLLGASIHGGISAAELAYLYLAMTLAIGIPVWWLVLRCTQGGGMPSRASFRDQLGFGLPAAGAALPQMLNLRVDQVFIAVILSAHSLGLYAAGVAWSSVVLPVTNALGLVLFPRLGQVDRRSRDAVIEKTAQVALLVAGVLGVGAAVTAGVAIPLLFGSGFEGGVRACQVLCVAGSVFGWNYVLEEGLRGAGKPSVPMKSQMLGLLLMALLLAALTPRFGIIGAAVASLVGYSATAMMNVRGLAREGCSVRALIGTGGEGLETLVAAGRGFARGQRRGANSG